MLDIFYKSQQVLEYIKSIFIHDFFEDIRDYKYASSFEGFNSRLNKKLKKYLNKYLGLCGMWDMLRAAVFAAIRYSIMSSSVNRR
jgi:hypothetical protein